MWASNFVFGPRSDSAQKQPKMASHSGHADERHVLDEMSTRPSCRQGAPTIAAPLLLPHLTIWKARGAPHFLIHSLHSLPCSPLPPLRCCSRLPPWPRAELHGRCVPASPLHRSRGHVLNSPHCFLLSDRHPLVKQDDRQSSQPWEPFLSPPPMSAAWPRRATSG
jgi:hypothetical protein